MKTMIPVRRYQHLENRVCEALKGPIAEIGVAAGGVIERLAIRFSDRQIYAYDTFTGIPKEKWQEGEFVKPGDFSSPGTEILLLRFPNVVVKKGIFPDTLGDENGFVVVHLDCDLYRSTLESLIALGPRMAKDGVIILDDWEWKFCPGVKRAVDELGLKAIRTVDYQAEIRY